MTDDTQVLARVATKLLGWTRRDETSWFTNSPDAISNVLFNSWLLTGNGMLAIFEAMQKQPEEVRHEFNMELMRLCGIKWIPDTAGCNPDDVMSVLMVCFTNLTPILVARAADKALT